MSLQLLIEAGEMVKTAFLMNDPYLYYYTDHFSPASTHKLCLHTG